MRGCLPERVGALTFFKGYGISSFSMPQILPTAIGHCNVLPSGTKKFSARERTGGTGPPNVNLGPPKISETTTAIMLKLKLLSDIVKYSLRVQKFLR